MYSNVSNVFQRVSTLRNVSVTYRNVTLVLGRRCGGADDAQKRNDVDAGDRLDDEEQPKYGQPRWE